jgi:broad specificity phosphatase PhoE
MGSRMRETERDEGRRGFISAGTIHLIRHGDAGDREAWGGPDPLRPLTDKGRAQAAALVGLIAGEPMQALVTSHYLRCRQTLEPVARARSMELTDVSWLAEGAPPRSSLAELLAMAAGGVVACSHGDVIGGILNLAARSGVDIGRDPRLQTGATWRFVVSDGRLSSAQYLAPPA